MAKLSYHERAAVN